MKRAAIIGTAVLLALMLVGCGCGDEKKTQYTPQDVKALVERAYDYVRDNGKEKALRAFMDPKGPFVKGELYIYAYDMNGKVISHGGDPSLVGKDLSGYKDPNGVFAVKDAAALANSRGSGWMVCMFPNPTTKKQQDKLIYVKKAGDGWFLGSGLYL